MVNRFIHRLSVLIVLVFMSIFNTTTSFAINGDSDLEFNIQEILTVSLTAPDNGVIGDLGQFLRNKFTLSVSSNNGNGFTASMTTNAYNSRLVNISSIDNTIPTLDSDYTRANFPVNYWGYSVNDTTAGNRNSTYKRVASRQTSLPNTIMYVATNNGPVNQDIYFGAKVDSTKAAGTYSATVVFSVVSGIIDSNSNPITPEDPVVPGSDPSNPYYDPNENSTVYTANVNSGGSSTTTTEISKGDNRSGYAAPQGVTTTTVTNISEGTPLATGLIITATIAATTGIIFFIIAKRKKDDEDEEEIDIS